jgi:uncharacterized membrane protein YoaK (UPF0700 family)
MGARSATAIRDALLVLLTFASGSSDAISYLRLGDVFISNMTGNTVLLGIALAQGQELAVSRAAVALVGYLCGVALCTVVVYRHDRPGIWPAVITTACAVELALLLVLLVWGFVLGARPQSAVASPAVYPLIALGAAAMGMQSTLVRALGVSGIVTTYITGTWTSLIVGLIGRLPIARPAHPGVEQDAPMRSTGLQAVVLGTYVVAAAVGGVAATRAHLAALVLPCTAVAMVIVVAWVRFGAEA